MANGGGIAKKTVAPADDLVDAATVARWLNCSTRMVRQYAEEGLAVRTGPGRFDLERSVGNVVLHLRELASGHRSEGRNVVKASAELKQSQKRLVDLRYNQLRAKLISMDEVEAVWSDLILATQFLFRSIAPRFRERAPYLSPQHYEMLAGVDPGAVARGGDRRQGAGAAGELERRKRLCPRRRCGRSSPARFAEVGAIRRRGRSTCAPGRRAGQPACRLTAAAPSVNCSVGKPVQ